MKQIQEEKKTYLSCDGTIAIIPLDEQTETTLNEKFKKDFSHNENRSFNVDNVLSYENDDKVVLSGERLLVLAKLIKNTKTDRIIISVKKDYPLLAECEDFKFVLAPRVGDD